MAGYDEEEELQLQDACGIFGCVSAQPWPTELSVPQIIYQGLVALQHRGQESAGMALTDGESAYQMVKHKGSGLVDTVFSQDVMNKLKGNLGIGHTRYSTAGGSDSVNHQPFVVETLQGLLAVAHNGELVNAKQLRLKVLRYGVGLTTGSDSELMTQLLALSPPCGEPNGANWLGRIKQVIGDTQGAFSLVLMTKDVVYAVRDPYGFRPLCLGRLVSTEPSKDGTPRYEGYVVSSESCGFTSIGATYFREVKPGEIVEISKDGCVSRGFLPHSEVTTALCIFEYVYFSRPDSHIEGQQVHCVRRRCGMQLAREAPAEADIVSTVPESATPAALGYAAESGIPYIEVLCKNRYVGRTFIQPCPRLRQLAVAKKFGPLTQNFTGKRVVLVDDSIVRGTTMPNIVRLLKEAGAKEVHVRIASPALKYPCYMGINIPTHEELIANRMTLDEMTKYFGAESVQYLSVDGLRKSVREGLADANDNKKGHCTACLTGEYPIKLDW